MTANKDRKLFGILSNMVSVLVALLILLLRQAADGEMAPYPQVPGSPKTEIEVFSSRLEQLMPSDPLKTESNARRTLVALESWRRDFDAESPPGWRENLKRFSVACDLYDKRVRLLLSRAEVTPEELANWDRFYSEEAKPLYSLSGPLMQEYIRVMTRYHDVTRFWKRTLREALE